MGRASGNPFPARAACEPVSYPIRDGLVAEVGLAYPQPEGRHVGDHRQSGWDRAARLSASSGCGMNAQTLPGMEDVMPNLTAIGFLGLGQMGAPMAERLLVPDVRLYVFDPRPEAMAPFAERGAIACASPAGVAAEAEIVFACLPNAQISEAVAAEIAGGPALRLYAEMSTIG